MQNLHMNSSTIRTFDIGRICKHDLKIDKSPLAGDKISSICLIEIDFRKPQMLLQSCLHKTIKKTYEINLAEFPANIFLFVIFCSHPIA